MPEDLHTDCSHRYGCCDQCWKTVCCGLGRSAEFQDAGVRTENKRGRPNAKTTNLFCYTSRWIRKSTTLRINGERSGAWFIVTLRCTKIAKGNGKQVGLATSAQISTFPIKAISLKLQAPITSAGGDTNYRINSTTLNHHLSRAE